MEAAPLTGRPVELRMPNPSSPEPVVSIVVAVHVDQHHLARLLESLTSTTRYRSFEVIVVGNDATRSAIDEQLAQFNGTARFIKAARADSIAAVLNLGIAAAAGEYILLANASIASVHPDWLGCLVESAEGGAGAVGPLILQQGSTSSKLPAKRSKPVVQQRGIAFRRTRFGVQGVAIGAGVDPQTIELPTVHEVPVVSTSCLLARRTSLLETPPGDRYERGTLDWDLCLRLRRFGPIMVDERAVVLDEHDAAPGGDASALVAPSKSQQRFFNELWGPEARRRLREEVLGPPEHFFFRVDEPRRLLVISGGRPHRAVANLERDARSAGFEITHEERGHVDIAVAFDVPQSPGRFLAHEVSAALVSDRYERWARSGSLDAAQHVIVPDRIAEARVGAAWGRGIAQIDGAIFDAAPGSFARVLELTRPTPQAMRIGVSTAAPDWEKAQRWGDTFLARGLMRAFQRSGHETTELIQKDWQGHAAASCDVVVHLRGARRRPTARGQWNVLWIISHPERVERDEYDDYDLICVASASHARQLSKRLRRPVHYLPQATDSDTFGIRQFDPKLASTILFVGIGRRPVRRAPRWMIRRQRSFSLYGRNWQGLPEEAMLRSEHLDNRDLAAAYRSASVVVADHHDSMRTGGFVANRIFDVFASGGLVVSDDVAGLREIFGDLVPVYRDADELESLLRSLLANAVRRRRLSRAGRALVESTHTLDHRAAAILELLDEL